MSHATRLSAIVPCVDGAHLAQKLDDLAALELWLAEIVVCFNGPEEELDPVRAIAESPRATRCVVSISPPLNKARALKDGLAHVTTGRILYTDVDCLLARAPGDLVDDLRSEDVRSFLVLRAPTRSEREIRTKLGRRRALGALYRHAGLLYLSARGGGYIAGDISETIDERALSDDLLFPAEYAAAHGRGIIPSEALVFYEAREEGRRRYTDKLPRLIYGSFQAVRLARSRRVRASIVVQKLAKYVLVALTPPAVVATLALMGLPLWPALLLLPASRLFIRTWEGLARGIRGAQPRW